MSLPINYECEGQLTIEDVFSPDLWYGKMYPAPSAQTKEKTSELSSKKQQKLSRKEPLYLNLWGANGQQADASWVQGGALLGEYTMHSFGECPSAERESHLSQILEDNPHPKYCLSAKACQGILNRANKRGKKLPEILEQALIKQATPLKLGGGCEVDSKGHKAGKGALVQTELSGTLGVSQDQTLITTKTYGLCSYDSNSMKSSNPHSGIYEADTARTLDNNGGNPACNQGGMMVVQGADMYNQTTTGDKAITIRAKADTEHLPCVVLEGNGSRPSHKGDGYKESDVSYTLNSTEQHAVCWDGSQTVSTLTANNANGSQRMPDKENFNAVITYGLDRASFNQGQNAQYNFSVEEDLAQTIVAKGPGGVMTQLEHCAQETTKE